MSLSSDVPVPVLCVPYRVMSTSPKYVDRDSRNAFRLGSVAVMREIASKICCQIMTREIRRVDGAPCVYSSHALRYRTEKTTILIEVSH